MSSGSLKRKPGRNCLVSHPLLSNAKGERSEPLEARRLRIHFNSYPDINLMFILHKAADCGVLAHGDVQVIAYPSDYEFVVPRTLHASRAQPHGRTPPQRILLIEAEVDRSLRVVTVVKTDEHTDIVSAQRPNSI